MKTMRMTMMMIALVAISAESIASMSMTDIRREARFLTDRMGHELGLSTRQYNDVYEINFDYLYQVNEVIDDVVYGYDDAIDYYYYLLDVRNEDLMYVLRSRQYRRFVSRDYFYRPIYMAGHTWGMRIWTRYTDRNYFYFGTPTCYHTYNGAHYRIHFAHSYYAGLYTHKLYHGAFRLWGGGYDHHHYDGWVCTGKKKYAHPESRPWHNAKNYEKSRRDLKSGFVSIPSRDANKRTVKADSEENRRRVVPTEASTRVTTSKREHATNTTGNRATTSSVRNTSGSRSRNTSAVKESKPSSSSRSRNTSISKGSSSSESRSTNRSASSRSTTSTSRSSSSSRSGSR